MGKTYYIRMNCTGFQDITVHADNEEDAKSAALNHFQCDRGQGEFCEFVDKNELADNMEIEV